MEDRGTSSTATECRGGLPARYTLAIMGFMAITLQYTMKANLSVAIVAMVKPQQHLMNVSHPIIKVDSNNETIWPEDTCPGPDDPSDSSNVEGNGEFDWDAEVQGHVLSSYYYGYVGSQLLGGYLAEKFGGRYVCGPGVFFSGVLTLLSPIAVRFNLYLFIAVRVVAGMFSGVVIPSLHSMVSKWYHPQERSTFAGIIFSAINAGGLVAMGISGVLVHAGGWPMAFYFFGVVSVLWFIPWLYLIYNTPDEHPRISPQEREYIQSGFSEANNKKLGSLPVPWFKIMTSLPVWAGILYHTGSAWVLYTLLSELPTYLKTILHFDVQQSGVISALPFLFAWVAGSGFGWLSQWLRTKGYLSHINSYRLFNGLNSVGSGICFIIITQIGCHTYTIVSLLIVISIANSCLYGGSYINHIDLAPNFAGSIAGILHTIMNSTGIFTPLVVGALTKKNETITQWNKAFYVATSVTVFFYIFYLIFGSAEEQAWNKPDTDLKDVQTVEMGKKEPKEVQATEIENKS